MSETLSGKPEWDVEAGDNGAKQETPVNQSVQAASAVAKAAKPTSVPNMVPQPDATHPTNKATTFAKGKLGSEYATEFSESFPDDYKASMQVLRAVDALPVRNRAEHDEKARRRKIIGKHIHRLQNGEPAPHIGGHELGELQRQRNNSASNRGEHIEKLKAAKSKLDAVISPLPEPGLCGELLGVSEAKNDEEALSMLSLAPKERLLAHADVCNLLAIARFAAINAELYRLENYDLLHPEEAIFENERELRGCTNPERIRELQARIAALKETGASHKAGQIALRGNVEKLWRYAFGYLEMLKSVSIKLCADWGLDAALAEEDFFKKFELPIEMTSLRRRFKTAIDELKAIPVNKNSLFAWFGVNDLADA